MSVELLKQYIDNEVNDGVEGDIEKDTPLFNYLYNLGGSTFKYKGDYYLTDLTFYQDIPIYVVYKVDAENCIRLD